MQTCEEPMHAATVTAFIYVPDLLHLASLDYLVSSKSSDSHILSVSISIHISEPWGEEFDGNFLFRPEYSKRYLTLFILSFCESVYLLRSALGGSFSADD